MQNSVALPFLVIVNIFFLINHTLRTTTGSFAVAHCLPSKLLNYACEHYVWNVFNWTTALRRTPSSSTCYLWNIWKQL